MGHKYVKDFKEGELVEATYLVREKSFDTARNGNTYISLELADRTGMVDARKWDARKDLFDSFSVDEFVKIKGRVEIYKRYPQLKLDDLKKVKDLSIDMAIYLTAVEGDRDEMFKNFLSKIKGIKEPYLKLLSDNIFRDKEIIDKFKMAPAATDFHHPYLGGLLEHTSSCMELVRMVTSTYPGINIDLLMCGAALHDIGKIDELSYRRSFYYTDKGRLIGHIVLGMEIVEKKMSEIPGFPDELKDLILHIILSHHGEHEWGSPKRPMCLEAVILHYIDNLDAKINGFRHFVKTYNEPDSNWTRYSKMFREFLYKKEIPNDKEVAYEEKKEG